METKRPELETLRIDISDDGRVGTLTLHRPDKLNALSARLLSEIPDAVHWFNSQEDVRALVVRGAGRCFSAGFDLDDFTSQTTSTRQSRANADLGRIAAESLSDVRAITVAGVHGHCIGGGVVLTAACDLRLAHSATQFRLPEVALGIPLAWGGIPRLVRELGPAITKELVLTCRPFDSQEAKDLRFINRVVEGEDAAHTVDEAAHLLAAQVAAQPEFALRTTKSQVNAVLDEIAGVARNASDADTLLAALQDEESRSISRSYLEQRRR